MEYLRDDSDEKEETATQTMRIETDSDENATQEVEIDQPVEAWAVQSNNTSWLKRLKFVGQSNQIKYNQNNK